MQALVASPILSIIRFLSKHYLTPDVKTGPRITRVLGNHRDILFAFLF